jgi:hypothetical protein
MPKKPSPPIDDATKAKADKQKAAHPGSKVVATPKGVVRSTVKPAKDKVPE